MRKVVQCLPSHLRFLTFPPFVCRVLSRSLHKQHTVS